MPGTCRFYSIVIGWIVLAGLSVAWSCPYCPPTDATLSERLAESDAACVVKFVSSKTGNELSQETTTFEVLTCLARAKTFSKGEQFVTSYGTTSNPGEQYLLLGQIKENEMEWALPIPLDELGHELNYILKAPTPERSAMERLTYFLKFLDSDISLISNDAFGEFARSKFEDVEALAPQIDRAKVRKWLENPDQSVVVRKAFYGLLLGLCGNEQDANYLEDKILAPIPQDQNRLGIDGMMAGYLMLRGESGLRTLMQKKCMDVPVELSVDDPRTVDLNALRITLSFLWDYRPKQFSRDSIRAEMRRYLDRPDFAELAIVDLARWKDWDSLDQLIRDYGKDPWESRSSREKVIRFCLMCVKYGAASKDPKSATQSAKAQKFLEGLDQELVKSVRESLSTPAAPKDDDKRTGQILRSGQTNQNEFEPADLNSRFRLTGMNHVRSCEGTVCNSPGRIRRMVALRFPRQQPACQTHSPIQG